MVTTIQLKDKTLTRLKYFKEFSKESYDEVINKVLDFSEERELTDEAISDIQNSLKDVRSGKGQSVEEVASELGVDL